MNLYRIILVDDEEEVRKSIIKKIDWEQAGFSVVGDAENGEDALEKLEVLEPDVVLTDIRMPYMDGLALAERIRQKYPSIKVVIFSGYDDFEYAQKAIKLNVTEYILKPVNVEELTAILKKIKSNLDEEIEHKRNVSLLRESYRKSLPILKEHFLNQMVKERMEEGLIENRLREYQIPLLGALKWTTAVIVIEPEESPSNSLSFHQERELIPISVRQLVEEKLRAYCRFAAFNSAEEIGIIAAIDADNSQTGFIDLLGDICRETRKVLEVSVTVGIGQSCEELSGISKSYQLAMNALGYKAIVGSGGTIYINDVEPVNRGKLQFDKRDESDLTAAIKFGSTQEICRVVSRIAGRMDDAKVHMRQYQAYLLGVVNSITQLMQQYDLDLSKMFGTEEDYFEVVRRLKNGEDFSAWLNRVACRMNEAMNQERDNTAKNVIFKAKQYIEENYQNPDLSVEMICRYLHMSPAYFSTVFKKETGQTYIAFLTEVRLGKAVELLNTTDDKTYVIASKVGYQEQNYFSYVFKKRFGVSPTKYRGALK